jgi:amino acid transporter
VLGFRTVLSTSAGLAYAAISFVGCVQVASYVAGDGAWLAILIAGVLALLAAFCFSELNALYPSAAAIRLYIKEAFNEQVALIVAFAYTMTVVAVIAADSYVVGSAITYVFPQTPTLLWILLLLGGALLANLWGIRIAGALQDVTTYALLASAIIISAIAIFHGGVALHTPLAGLRNPGGLFTAVATGVFVFSAFEWVTPLSEEISNHRLIPRGMFLALGLLFVSYALFTLAATHLLTPAQIQGVANGTIAPIPQMFIAEKALGDVGKWWMLVATLFTGVMTFNGGFATASRFLYAAAREGTLPPVFARLNRFTVPWVTIMVLAGSSALIAVVIFALRGANVLILVGAALEAMIYTVAGLCVIQLRRRKPQELRSFKIPGGLTIPLLTVMVFGVLFVGAVLPGLGGTTGALVYAVPGVTVAIFALTTLYVFTVVPRLKAQLAAQRATRRRRPVAAATPNPSDKTED